MTWEEARDLTRAAMPHPSSRVEAAGRGAPLVAILPTGAVEAHGPHLPLDTDVIIAQAMARSAAERLESRGALAVLLPPLCYTAAPFAEAFPGTLSVTPGVVTALLVDVARSLTAQGAAALAVANAHLDPAHLGAIAAAVAAGRDARLLPIVAPDLTRKPWAPRLGEEFRSGACHAGRYEGSIVMAERPAAVREAIRRALPPNDASLSVAIRNGKRTFEEAGGARAYFGRPAEATAAEGAATIGTLGEILAEAVAEALEARR